jgi:DNA topoisomerase III
MQGFISKMGRPFAAILRIDGDHKLEFDFGQRDEDNLEPVDFSQSTRLGACPKCGSSVFEHGMSYLCEKSVGPEKSCDFKSGKVILQQDISPEQMTKLLETGRTDLLEGFISSRTRRKFKAYLSRGSDGKVSFEFEPRPEKKGKAPTKSASRKKTVEGVEAAPKKAVKKVAVKKVAVKKVAAKKSVAKKVVAKKAVKKATKKVTKTAAIKAT